MVKKPEDKALHNCTIVLHGKLSKSNKQLKTTIQDLGGEVATKITPETACVISNEGMFSLLFPSIWIAIQSGRSEEFVFWMQLCVHRTP